MRRLKSSDCEDSLVCEVIERSNPWRVGANKRSRIVVNLGIVQSLSVLATNWRPEFPRDSRQKTAAGALEPAKGSLEGDRRCNNGKLANDYVRSCLFI